MDKENILPHTPRAQSYSTIQLKSYMVSPDKKIRKVKSWWPKKKKSFTRLIPLSIINTVKESCVVQEPENNKSCSSCYSDYSFSNYLSSRVSNNCGQEELFSACFTGDLKLVRSLLSKFDINCKNREHFDASPLHIAASQNHIEICKLLVRTGANVNQQDSLQRTPLHIAASLGYHEVVIILLSSNAKVNIRDKFGYRYLYSNNYLYN